MTTLRDRIAYAICDSIHKDADYGMDTEVVMAERADYFLAQADAVIAELMKGLEWRGDSDSELWFNGEKIGYVDNYGFEWNYDVYIFGEGKRRGGPFTSLDSARQALMSSAKAWLEA